MIRYCLICFFPVTFIHLFIRMELKDQYFRIRDNCRRGLIGHLEEACSKIPEKDHVRMLDIGCGTGVPTCWLAEHYSGMITAIDIDREALDFLRGKIHDLHLDERVKVHHVSFSDYDCEPEAFDLILAEGFLNVIGFEDGFNRVVKILAKRGYFIIHDEFKDHASKIAWIGREGCRIIDTLCLDETVWWNDYYQKLESEISRIKNPGLLQLFENDLKEIEYFHRDPSPFRSMYYIVEKG